MGTVISSLNLFPRSDSSQFSVAAWIKLASTTSYVPRVIAQRPGTLRFQLITSTSSAFSSFYAVLLPSMHAHRTPPPALMDLSTHVSCPARSCSLRWRQQRTRASSTPGRRRTGRMSLASITRRTCASPSTAPCALAAQVRVPCTCVRVPCCAAALTQILRT